MKKDIKFTDFKPDELIGKTVLYEWGRSYDTHLSKAIRTIVKVTKTGFKISKEDCLFSLNNGDQKGLTGRQNMGTISKCKILTEEQANEYRFQWAKNRDIRLLKDIVTEKLDTLTHEQLLAINLIINPIN